MRIGIDFDHVLFDTEKFKKHLFEEFPEFDSTYTEAQDERGVYSVSRHAEVLDVPVTMLMNAVDHASECVFEDVELLGEVDAELVIVSRGDPEFQAEKIRQSGILEVIESFEIVEHEPKDRGTGIEALIDDREKEFERTGLDRDRFMLFDRSSHGAEHIVEWIEGLES